MKKLALTAIAAITLTACAQSPEQITAASVSPSVYTHMDCRALNIEASRINNRLNAVTGAQKSRADRDATMTAVSLFLFWPAAFAIGAGQDHSAEIAQLRGEAEAISHAALVKGCR